MKLADNLEMSPVCNLRMKLGGSLKMKLVDNHEKKLVGNLRSFLVVHHFFSKVSCMVCIRNLLRFFFRLSLLSELAISCYLLLELLKVMKHGVEMRELGLLMLCQNQYFILVELGTKTSHQNH